MRYRVKRVLVQTSSDEEILDDYLSEHWEPFAVTMVQYSQYVYHLRRREFDE